MESLLSKIKKLGTKKSKPILSTSAPKEHAAVAVPSGPKPKRSVTIRNNKRIHGFNLNEVPENEMTANNYMRLVNLSNARQGVKHRHRGNTRGRYVYTSEIPKNAAQFVKMTEKEAVAYAKAHAAGNTRAAFKSALKKSFTNGNINAVAYRKLLGKFNSTYKVFGDKTLEEIREMELDEFNKFMESLSNSNAIALYEYIDEMASRAASRHSED